ncbi:hypothetical protein A2U01_0046645, partial [Trifolium medium]|nr:hypothetical protein [Trifolium medium]
MVQQTMDKVKQIRARMKVTQDRQKIYADKRHRPFEFEAGEHYQITERIGNVAYRIALPPILSQIHYVFHVSQLRKYILDPSHVIMPDDIQLKENLSFEVPPIKIADRKTKRLRTKEIPLVK